MSKTNTHETDDLLLKFNNTNMGLVGDATGLRGSTAAGSLFFSLHTADPGEAGDQTTSEVTYTSYGRASKGRNATDFTVTGNAVTVNSTVTFPAGTGGSGTATHWGLGASASGAGKLMYKGTISPTIVTGNGVTPTLASGTVVTED